MSKDQLIGFIMFIIAAFFLYIAWGCGLPLWGSIILTIIAVIEIIIGIAVVFEDPTWSGNERRY